MTTINDPAVWGLFYHYLLTMSMILSFASPRFNGRGVLWSCIIGYLVYRTLTGEFPHNIQARYGLSSSWFWYVITIQKQLCYVPEEAYWRLNKEIAEGTYMPFGIEKIRWAIALWMNPRGIGWSHQIKRVPRPLYNNNQKWAFILGQLRRFGTAYIVADACILFTSTFKFPDVLEHITWENKTKIGLASGLLILSSWQMQWTFVSILGVASRLSDPEDWPPFFGAISELATVKAFWGSYWHQVLHEGLIGYSRTLVRILHIPNHTIWSYLTHLSVGFFISGLFHAIVLTYLIKVPPTPNIFRSNLGFFLAQVPVICLEQAVIKVCNMYFPVKRARTRDVQAMPRLYHRLLKFLGLMWVISWLLVSGWQFLDVYYRIGMVDWKVPFPIVGRILYWLKHAAAGG